MYGGSKRGCRARGAAAEAARGAAEARRQCGEAQPLSAQKAAAWREKTPSEQAERANGRAEEERAAEALTGGGSAEGQIKRFEPFNISPFDASGAWHHLR